MKYRATVNIVLKYYFKELHRKISLFSAKSLIALEKQNHREYQTTVVE